MRSCLLNGYLSAASGLIVIVLTQNLLAGRPKCFGILKELKRVLYSLPEHFIIGLRGVHEVDVLVYEFLSEYAVQLTNRGVQERSGKTSYILKRDPNVGTGFKGL